MPICRNKNVIFIHIPKTGGTYIERDFNFIYSKENAYTVEDIVIYKNIPFQYQHLNCSLMVKNNILNEIDVNSFYKFTVVRNPYTRLLSEFMWKTWFETFNPEIFHDFLYSNIINPKLTDPECIHFLPQSFYFDVKYNNIIKFETLKQDLSNVYNELNIQKKPSNKKINCSRLKKVDLVPEIKNKTINLINHVYKSDFELGNYDML